MSTDFHARQHQASGDRLALPLSTSPIDKIHHADCFVLMNWLYRMGVQVDAIMTDMPYGTTACSWDVRVDFDQWWVSVKRILNPRGVFLTTASEPFASLLRVSNLDWYKYDWVWVKSMKSDYIRAKLKPLNRHEQILIFSDGTVANGSDYLMPYYPQMEEGKPYKKHQVSGNTGTIVGKRPSHIDFIGTISINEGERYPNTVLEYPHGNNNSIHPNQKPDDLYEYLIRTYTRPGELVLDPFCGSGTTGLAALKTGRHFICGDSDLGYVEAARKRIQNADPMQPSQIGEGVTQLSLFAEAG